MQESTRNGRKLSRLDEACLGRDIAPRLEGHWMRHPGVAAVAVVLDEQQSSTALQIPAHECEHGPFVVDKVQRVRHDDTIELGESEASREVGTLGAELGLRHRGDEGAAELGERSAIAIDRVDDPVWADEIRERQRERTRTGAEIRPVAALTLGYTPREKGDVVRVIYKPSWHSRLPSVMIARGTDPSASMLSS